jgi:hypothetical protein
MCVCVEATKKQTLLTKSKELDRGVDEQRRNCYFLGNRTAGELPKRPKDFGRKESEGKY